MAEQSAPDVPGPAECRRRAHAATEAEYTDPRAAAMWALLAIAGELAEIRRDLRRAR